MIHNQQRFLIIASTYHTEIMGALLEGACRTLRESGTEEHKIAVVRAPGAFELPVIAAKAASTKVWDAIICLGCVIKGETPHNEYISAAVANSLAQLSAQTQIPITFGVLTPNTVAQARSRSGLEAAHATSECGKPAVCNKGVEAAKAALLALDAINELERMYGEFSR